jgi:Putative zinc-finger
MNCADFEVLLCDYLDGTLDAAQRHAIEEHQRTCASCAEFARDVMGAVAFMERAETIEPPVELLTRITFEIPTGGQEKKGWRSLFGGWLRPILQPRFAMGMAMTILSFSMLGRLAGIEGRQLKPADLHPAKVWAAADDKVHRAWARAVKYYENLRLVYEVRSRLQEWTEQEQEELRKGRGEQPAAAPNANEGKERK